MKRYALVGPTRDRDVLFAECVAAVRPQVDVVVTVAHGDHAAGYAGPLVDLMGLWPGEYNVSAMWNIGYDLIEADAGGEPYVVFTLNDDALPAPDWCDRLLAGLGDNVGGSGFRHGPNRKPKAIAGHGFVFRSGFGIRADPDFRNYYSDDAVQKRCERAGGFVVVPGAVCVNRLADQNTQGSRVLQRWNREDWPVFKSRYGMPTEPWDTPPLGVVVSAPSGVVPGALTEACAGGDVLVLTDDRWEVEHLKVGAARFERFLFLKESTRIVDPTRFWEEINRVQGGAWLFAAPSCYMGVFQRGELRQVLRRVPRIRSKEASILWEAKLHRWLRMPSVWPEVSDGNALRMEGGELVIGNDVVEKFKGTARCGGCAGNGLPGVCPHLVPS